MERQIEDIEQIAELNTQVTPPEKVTRNGIKKLIDFFKRTDEKELPIKQIETPIEDDPYTTQKEEDHDDYDDDHEDHDDDDDDDDNDYDDD